MRKTKYFFDKSKNFVILRGLFLKRLLNHKMQNDIHPEYLILGMERI